MAPNIFTEMMVPRDTVGDGSRGGKVKETAVEGVVEGAVEGVVKEE